MCQIVSCAFHQIIHPIVCININELWVVTDGLLKQISMLLKESHLGCGDFFSLLFGLLYMIESFYHLFLVAEFFV